MKNMKKRTLLLLAALTMVLGNSLAQGPNNSGTYYKEANGLKGAALKTKLGKIINPHYNIGYDGLFKAYEQTDKRPDGKVRDFLLRLVLGADMAPEVSFAGGRFENAAGEIPAIATTTTEGGTATTLLYFTETAAGVFLVKGEAAKEVA